MLGICISSSKLILFIQIYTYYSCWAIICLVTVWPKLHTSNYFYSYLAYALSFAMYLYEI